LLAESDAVVAKVGGVTYLTRVTLAACRGDEQGLSAHTEAIERVATPGGQGLILAVCDYVTSILHNGLGNYATALEAARRASEGDELGVCSWALPELIEAAVRSGDGPTAVAAHERLADRAHAAGTDLAHGFEARSRALISTDGSAEAAYGEAIELLSRTRVRFHLARALLVYGEWLRRENRRVDAREQLRVAYEMLSDFGAEAFAERARRELAATGVTVRKRTDETRGDLTPQELQIARLGADGYTNPEIGAQLFLSPRTVEWHLRKVFTKLDISSRRQLREALPSGAAAA
jgi:DNA-binding CsgD family transcriptional regulator